MDLDKIISIADLFTGCGSKTFRIPDFQRQYCWGEEECEMLIKDFYDDYEKNNGRDPDHRYFLGIVVSYKNTDENSLDLIDGQQRITTIFLLLRMLLEKFENVVSDKQTNREEDLNWDKYYTLVVKFKEMLWLSNVENDIIPDKPRLQICTPFDNRREDFNMLSKYSTKFNSSNIHQSGTSSPYISNFCFFRDSMKTGTYFPDSTDNVYNLYKFADYIIKKCGFLEIQCKDLNQALTVFTSLNDRGIQLSDADVYKGIIYKKIDIDEDRKSFINDWDSLCRISEKIRLQRKNVLDELFAIYYFYVRCEKTSEPIADIKAVRSFFTSAENEKYLRKEIIKDLICLANFWYNLQERVEYKIEIQKWYQCLAKISGSKYWNIPLSVFFLKIIKKDFNDYNEANGINNNAASQKTERFLKKLTALTYYITLIGKSGSNTDTQKTIAYKLITKMRKTIDADELFDSGICGELVKLYDIEKGMTLKSKEKGLVFLHAYINDKQDELLPPATDVEHIFPTSWSKGVQSVYNIAKDDNRLQEAVEKFGNKICLEKLNNIKCSDKFFKDKIDIYRKGKDSTPPSSISDVKDFITTVDEKGIDKWDIERINTRNDQIAEDFLQFFKDTLFSKSTNYSKGQESAIQASVSDAKTFSFLGNTPDTPDINEETTETFKEYLRKTVCEKTFSNYFPAFKTVERMLIEKKIISESLSPKTPSSVLNAARKYVSSDEEFLKYNKLHHNRFSAAWQKFEKYLLSTK